MRFTIAFAILFSVAVYADVDPILAVPIDRSLLDNDRVRQLFADLIAQSGHGRLPMERAAFLRLMPDGTYEHVPWPFSATYQSARFTGTVPNRTVAIVHTHPLRMPRPSSHDRELAQRLGLPIVVITPRSLMVAQPDGTLQRF